MSSKLKAKKIAFLGGDAREIKLLTCLQDIGADLQVVGTPPREVKAAEVSSVAELDKKVDAVVAPMTGIDDNYQVKKTFTEQPVKITEEFISQLPLGSKFFIGFAKPKLEEWCKQHKVELVELAALDEVAILNAVPTAEGAIKLAIEKSQITLHRNNSFVLGLGRVGLTLARMLKGLGSITYGVARKPKDLARAREMRLNPVRFADLAAEIEQADFIFNTAPAPVLTEEVLQEADSEVLIIDLASAPGGTDFEAAGKLGIQAELALGLPGKIAPESAGKILAEVIPSYLRE